MSENIGNTTTNTTVNTPDVSEYLTLDVIKKHLNIDSTFTDDDDYLAALSYVAEDVVTKYLDCELTDLLDDGELPKAVKHAMLLFIGNMYKNRESTTNLTINVIPHAFDLLCDLYRNYKYTKAVR